MSSTASDRVYRERAPRGRSSSQNPGLLPHRERAGPHPPFADEGCPRKSHHLRRCREPPAYGRGQRRHESTSPWWPETRSPPGPRGTRHRPEIEQELAALGSGGAGELHSHLLPLDQGKLATCFDAARRAALQGRGCRRLSRALRGRALRPPLLDGRRDLRYLRDTNECHIYLTVQERGRVPAFSAIDNIWKGASGRACRTST